MAQKLATKPNYDCCTIFDKNNIAVHTGINIVNLTNSFLRIDGGNTAIGAIDVNSNIMKNVSDPVSN